MNTTTLAPLQAGLASGEQTDIGLSPEMPDVSVNGNGIKEVPVPEIKKPFEGQQPYPYDDVLKQSTAYFNGDELAARVWINKYALKDSNGNIYERTPDDMHRRITREIVRIENKYPSPMAEEDIYETLKSFKYIVPQGGPMAGIGNDYQIASLSNCFVIGNDGQSDSYGGILKIDEEQVQLMKRRGGVGHDLSHIRPKGSPVMNSALTSTGIVPFMERFSNSTREVAQDGRRGALMLSISIKHPDATDFIDAKMEGTKVTGANVSVRIDDEFMETALHNRTYTQHFPVDSSHPVITKEINAGELWKKIIHNAWKSAEPGVLFWDTVIRESIPDCYADLGFKTVSTNPCGEIPLCPYDSCRLLAVNLYNFVEGPFTSKAWFNFGLFKRHVRTAQRMMDDIIDLELEKIDRILAKISGDPEQGEIKAREVSLWQKIRKKCIEGRRMGMGVTGEGDMLAALGIRYGAAESIVFSSKIHKKLALEAYRSSVDLAKERGAFPVYDTGREEKNPFIQRLAKADQGLYEEMKKHGRRNIAILTIAPTGTASLMTQTTSGIEPVFMVAYKRRRKVNPSDQNVKVDFVDSVGDSWEEFNVFHYPFTTWMRVRGYDLEKVNLMSDEELAVLIKKSPYYKATSADVDWINKVKLQGTVQKWVDHSISVTVNVPYETPETLVAEIYKTGWQSGCKGITVYREGSRSGVLVSNNGSSAKKSEDDFIETQPPKRPVVLGADIVRFQNNNEKWVAVVGLYNKRPYEIFTGRADAFFLPAYVESGWVFKNRLPSGKSRYDFQYKDKDGYNVTIEGLSRSFEKEFWNYAKLISAILRHGMPLPYLVDIVTNMNLNEEYLNTWKNGVARALKKFIPDGTKPPGSTSLCPSCGNKTLVYSEGCITCKGCGHTKCN